MTRRLKVFLFIVAVLLIIPLTDAIFVVARGGPEATYFLLSPYYWMSFVSLASWEARIDSWIILVDPDKTFASEVDGISFEYPRMWGDMQRVKISATTQEQYNVDPNRCVNPETIAFVFVTKVIGESGNRVVTGFCPGEVATTGQGSWTRGYVMKIEKEKFLNLDSWIHSTEPGPFWS